MERFQTPPPPLQPCATSAARSSTMTRGERRSSSSSPKRGIAATWRGGSSSARSPTFERVGSFSLRLVTPAISLLSPLPPADDAIAVPAMGGTAPTAASSSPSHGSTDGFPPGTAPFASKPPSSLGHHRRSSSGDKHKVKERVLKDLAPRGHHRNLSACACQNVAIF